MAEQNICEICGGAKNLNLPKLKTSRGMPITSVIPPELRTARVCLGYHESKHDGKLDEKGDCRVDYSPKSKAGTYIRILMHDDGAVLTPAQAISLLSWLEQNRPELIALAEAEGK